MDKNYFPLTNGGLDLTKFHAVQFGHDAEGAALIYRRENVKTDQYTLILNGLSPEKTYVLTNYDDPNEAYEISGAKLMESGIAVTVKDCPKCAIYLYQALR